MELSNKPRMRTIKRRFSLVVFCFIITALFFVWKRQDTTAIFIGLGLVIFIILILVMNFNYIYFSTNNNKITLKYYPIISLLSREYSAIEFPKELLYKYELKSASIFSDLTLTVKMKRGIADYPQVSLTALTKNEIAMIREELEFIQKSE